MRTRTYLAENQDDMGTAGTKTYNLDFTDPISEIDLLFEATNGGTSNKNNPIEANISKIEIVDGGSVLWDLPGDVALAYWSHLNQSLAQAYRSGAASDAVCQPISIRFGRDLYDPELAFNPNAHKNPQLKVTFDEATIRAAGATGFVSDSFNLSIMVKLMENAASPSGFLSCREVQTFTSVASGDTKVELPTDKSIRALMVRVYKAGVHPSTDITRYKLSCDGGKFIPFDLYYRNLRDYMSEYFKPVLVPQYSVTDNGEAHETWIADGFAEFIRAHSAQHIVGAGTHAGGQLTVSIYTDAGVGVDGSAVHFGVVGLPFHQTYIYPFGRLNEMTEWFDARAFNKADLFLTNGGAGAEVNVAVQQLYTY